MNPNQNQNPLDPQTPQPPVQPQPVTPLTPVAPMISPLNPTPTPAQPPIQPAQPSVPPQQPIGTATASPIDSTSDVYTNPAIAAARPRGILSRGQKVKLIFAALLLIFAGYFIIEQNMKDNSVVANGVKAEGIATGEARERKTKRSTSYRAIYEYEHQKGYKATAYGDKSYSEPEDIKEGQKATIYYIPDDPGKGTVVKDEP